MNINDLEVLKNINNGSITKVIFYNSEDDLSRENLDSFNIIFAGNGVYSCIKNTFGCIFDKIQGFKYTNMNLLEFEYETVVYPNVPKLPLGMFDEIVQAFKYVSNKTKDELMFNVYWDIENEGFILDLVKQDISPGHIKYEYSREFELDENYIRYLQIHSHNTMTANFSTTDNNDETGRIACYFGVLGSFKDSTTCLNVDNKFRVYTGSRFVEMDIASIIEMPNTGYELDEDLIKQLDEVIETSAMARVVKTTTSPFYTGMRTATPTANITSAKTELTDHEEEFMKYLDASGPFTWSGASV
jgi:hypothetical protein